MSEGYIDLQGRYTVQYNSASAVVSGAIEKVLNNSTNTTSGTLRIETWVSTNWWTDADFTGYRTSVLRFDQINGAGNGLLSPGQFFYNITWSAPWVNKPPAGIYNIFLAITEYTNQDSRNDGYRYVDWGELSGYLTIAPPGVSLVPSEGVDWIVGTRNDDTLFALGGNDYLFGGPGDDVLDGGPGRDTAGFSGNRSAYTIIHQPAESVYLVEGPDGRDVLRSIEKLQFSDGELWIEDAAVLTGWVHRLYNTQNGAHLYTVSNDEANVVRETLSNFRDEGLSFKVAPDDAEFALDVFRLYNTQNGAHFYTTSLYERDWVIANLSNMRYEGKAFSGYSRDLGPQEELYRLYNTQNGAHLYTASEHERDTVLATLPHFNYEGVAFYVDVI